jgi:nucleoside-diphosphate-sugar epimerase
LNELARVMRDALHQPDLTPIYQAPRAGDVRHSLADLAHTRASLNYQPIVDFESGLRATIEWYRTVLA